MSGAQGKVTRHLWGDAIGTQTQSEREDQFVQLPGELVDFDTTTQTATVKILHRPVNPHTGEEITPPELKEIMVQQPRGGGFCITAPLKPGQPVDIRFDDRDMGEARTTGAQAASPSNRLNSLSDATVTPGRYAENAKLENYDPDNYFIGTEDGNNGWRIRPNGTMTIESNGEELFAIVDELLSTLSGEQDQTGTGLVGQPKYAELAGRLGKMKA